MAFNFTCIFRQANGVPGENPCKYEENRKSNQKSPVWDSKPLQRQGRSASNWFKMEP